MQNGLFIWKTLKKIYSVFFVIIFSALQLFAGETGKIAGRVTDKQTGEALLGVNIILKGTTMGAATDEQGRYYIINIPPGTYNLQASAIGFHTITITDVRVKI